MVMAIRVLDLFCGGGGSSWGAKAAGAKIICGVDANPIATAAFARNFSGARAVQLKMNHRTRPEVLGELGQIDLLLASPECTNHTCARGSRPVDEASRATARFVVNFARHMLPRWVVVENVVQMRNWDGYDKFIKGLADLGYNISPHVLDARDFGVPQQRRRLFVLCDLEGPPPDLIKGTGRPAPTVTTILDRHGTWPTRPLYRPGRAAATLERAERAIAVLGKGVPFLIVYYGSDSSGGWQPLDRPLRTITTIDRFGLVTWADKEPHLRMLQVPELMRAMGFVGNYDLSGIGQRRDRIKLLGNGVAPPVMEAVIRSMIANSSRDSAVQSPDRRRRVA
jgi:DNA (cytosine-5)-methyltransferase 1